jgi:hypothetical protein
VPKLRERNPERHWQSLARDQRSLGNLLDWLWCLYIMGLSLRDLQEALYLVAVSWLLRDRRGEAVGMGGLGCRVGGVGSVGWGETIAATRAIGGLLSRHK